MQTLFSLLSLPGEPTDMVFPLLSFQTSKAPELVQYKVAAMRRLRLFNDDSIPDDATPASLASRRMLVAKAMFGKLGTNSNIEQSFFVIWGCNTFIGDQVYMNRGYDLSLSKSLSPVPIPFFLVVNLFDLSRTHKRLSANYLLCS